MLQTETGSVSGPVLFTSCKMVYFWAGYVRGFVLLSDYWIDWKIENNVKF